MTDFEAVDAVDFSWVMGWTYFLEARLGVD